MEYVSYSKCYALIHTDIDECSRGDVCHILASCNDTEGSYECNCVGGFEGDGFNCTGKDNNYCVSLCLL